MEETKELTEERDVAIEHFEEYWMATINKNFEEILEILNLFCEKKLDKYLNEVADALEQYQLHEKLRKRIITGENIKKHEYDQFLSLSKKVNLCTASNKYRLAEHDTIKGMILRVQRKIISQEEEFRYCFQTVREELKLLKKNYVFLGERIELAYYLYYHFNILSLKEKTPMTIDVLAKNIDNIRIIRRIILTYKSISKHASHL